MSYVESPSYDCRNCPESQELTERLSQFDWKPFEEHILAHGSDAKLPSNLTSKYLDALMPWIENAPPVKPTQLKPPNVTIDCANPKFGNTLSGIPRGTPARILDFMTFGSELDILEIRLHELDGLVETHVVVESTRTHGFAEKPFFLKRNLARFAGFRDRLVDLLFDDRDAEMAKIEGERKRIPYIRQMEVELRNWIWRRYVKDHGEPSPNDLLIYGDVDEIPSREVVAHLKHCELQDGVEDVAVAIDFYRTNFDWVLRRQPKHIFPRVHKPDAIVKLNGFPRLGGGANVPDHYGLMPGGGHLNRFGSPAQLLWKHLAVAEGGKPPRGNIEFMKNPNKLWPLLAQGMRECCDDDRQVVRPREFETSEFIPWFADVNWQRYPHFFPKRSGALKDYVPSMSEVASYKALAAFWNRTHMKKYDARVG